MRKPSLQDQRLDQLLLLAMKQMQGETAAPLRFPKPTSDDLFRADQAFQAAMKRCSRDAPQMPSEPEASMQRREKT